jgi:hypothetical protein
MTQKFLFGRVAIPICHTRRVTATTSIQSMNENETQKECRNQHKKKQFCIWRFAKQPFASIASLVNQNKYAIHLP